MKDMKAICIHAFRVMEAATATYQFVPALRTRANCFEPAERLNNQ